MIIIYLDGQLTMKVHVQRICQTSFYQLRQLRSVRRSLSVNACTALVHVFVTSRLDYCNSLLAGIGDGLIDQLQTVLRVAARLVLRKRKFDPISADIRDRLHWLPIRSRIDFKLGLLVYKCLQGTAPGYLTEMLVQKSTVPALSRLRSTARGDLLVPRTKTKTIGPRSFATSGPALWNNLPDDLRDPSLSLTVFKQRLKSYLFKQCWCTIQPKLTFAATFQLLHLHSSVRSFASEEVTFTLHYITSGSQTITCLNITNTFVEKYLFAMLPEPTNQTITLNKTSLSLGTRVDEMVFHTGHAFVKDWKPVQLLMLECK